MLLPLFLPYYPIVPPLPLYAPPPNPIEGQGNADKGKGNRGSRN